MGIDSNNQHQKELLRGSGATFVYRIATMLLSYIILMVISHYYGASGVGEYNVLTSLLSILTMLGCLGFSTSVVRFVSQYMVQQKEYLISALYSSVLKVCILVSALISIVFVLFADTLAEYYFHDLSLSFSFVVLSIALPFTVLTTIQVEFIRGFKKVQVSEFLRNLSILLVNTLLIIVLHQFYAHQNIPFLTYCVGVLCTFFLTTYILQRDIAKLSKTVPPEADPFSFRWHLLTSLPMILTAFVQLINGKVNTLMLAYYVPKVDVGVFSMVFKISTITNFVLMAMKTVAMPKISELFWSEKKEELKKLIHTTNAFIFGFSLLVFIALFLGSGLILDFLGPEYKSGGTCFKILAFTQFYNSYCGMVAVFLNMTGHHTVFLRIILLSTALNILLNLIWIPLYGIEGAAYAGLITTVLWNTIGAIYIYRKYGIATFFRG